MRRFVRPPCLVTPCRRAVPQQQCDSAHPVAEPGAGGLARALCCRLWGHDHSECAGLCCVTLVQQLSSFRDVQREPESSPGHVHSHLHSRGWTQHQSQYTLRSPELFGRRARPGPPLCLCVPWPLVAGIKSRFRKRRLCAVGRHCVPSTAPTGWVGALARHPTPESDSQRAPSQVCWTPPPMTAPSADPSTPPPRAICLGHHMVPCACTAAPLLDAAGARACRGMCPTHDNTLAPRACTCL